ncbi:hypothetical protein GGTG_10811 [Gaeumannomyces tritici R3-111a-1]|uniref:Uncharacterized protein n=1 Tax=Gaeumannomyces tritici (strain R3-111a-1) TaxID=644352 RepID=J3PBD8_GAET3|nr:hypothetical protein GGTG_10811 [Gaeumannomyces tritici R3-111a-1]EJT71554.1 hypothetical protein GGTG_10811 [Gaeumannomyces tritici R3-111a-1]
MLQSFITGFPKRCRALKRFSGIPVFRWKNRVFMAFQIVGIKACILKLAAAGNWAQPVAYGIPLNRFNARQRLGKPVVKLYNIRKNGYKCYFLYLIM